MLHSPTLSAYVWYYVALCNLALRVMSFGNRIAYVVSLFEAQKPQTEGWGLFLFLNVAL